MEKVKEVPYGVADFVTMMEQNLYYVDKTMFILYQYYVSCVSLSSYS